MKSIPISNVLVEDYNKLNTNCEFKTRMVTKVTNFTSTFSKVGHLGLKVLLNNNIINYSNYTIKQASQVK